MSQKNSRMLDDDDYDIVDSGKKRSKGAHLPEWLESIGLSQYASVMAQNGYDYDTVTSCGLDEDDFKVLGISMKGHQKKLQLHLQQLKRSNSQIEEPVAAGKKLQPRSDDVSTVFAFCEQALLTSKGRGMDAAKACSYLDLAIANGSAPLADLCIQVIFADIASLFQTDCFQRLSKSAIVALIKSEMMPILEQEVFSLVLLWLSENTKATGDDLWQYVRFGLISPEYIMQVVEPCEMVPSSYIYKAYRYHSAKSIVEVECATKGSSIQSVSSSSSSSTSAASAASAVGSVSISSSSVPSSTLSDSQQQQQDAATRFFTERVGQRQARLGSTEDRPPLALVARGAMWELSMSSQYPGLPNNRETLIDDRYGYPGAATNYVGRTPNWIQATFRMPVLVSKIKLSEPTQGAFTSQGWGAGYMSYNKIQYSTDGTEWITCYDMATSGKTSKSSDSPLVIVDISPPMRAKFWRLMSEQNYCITGTLIFE